MIEEMKVNVSEVARKTGYHRSHILRVIGGDVTGSVKCLSAIAEALGISVDQTLKMIKDKKIHA